MSTQRLFVILALIDTAAYLYLIYRIRRLERNSRRYGG